MKYAIVIDGVVENIAVADAPLADNWFEVDDTVSIGDLYDGETFTKPDPTTHVPQYVARRQAKQALFLAGLLDDAQAAIDAIPDDTDRGMALLYWTEADTFERSHPLIEQIGAAVGLDSDGIDQLFITAKAIP